MTVAQPSLCVVIADADPAAGPVYQQLLPHLGHRTCSVTTGTELLDLCRATRPDLVIADAGLPGLADASAVLRELSVAVILVGGDTAESPLDGSVFARLARPVTEPALASSLAVATGLLGQVRSLRAEVTGQRHQLVDRKLIGRAKEVVLRRIGSTEEEAFRRLRTYASDRNLKLADVARRVLEAEAVFHDLDECGRELR